MPKSVLCYVQDKGQYFVLETYFTQSPFPNKETDSGARPPSLTKTLTYSSNLENWSCFLVKKN